MRPAERHRRIRSGERGPSVWGEVFRGAGIALAGLAAGGDALAQTDGGGAPEPLAIDQLLSIESVVGGSHAWSPDGSAILFESGLLGGLATVPPEGGFPTRIPADLGGAGHFLSSRMPGWSPSGRWISYVSDKSGAPEIWLWSTLDGSEVRLTDLGARVNSMSWSPDERSIAFAGDRYGNYDIWRVDVESGRVRRLTDDKRYDVFPAWTPDSRDILYVRLDERWEDHEVIEMKAEGGDSRVVIEDRDFFDYGAGATFGYPQPSPDGRWILFRSQRGGWINYWLAPRSGGEPRPVARAEADQSGAAWSPDGRWIAYSENHNGRHELRIAPAEGGEPRVLAAPEEGVVSGPSWSPDGRSLAYAREGLTSPRDLRVVEVADGRDRRLTRSTPAGNFEQRLVIPEKIVYESTDGYSIPAYLYRPPGAPPAGGWPGLMWIHGGPTSQFHDTFQPHVQFFAQRGYAVLLPNIRGSSGYGTAFADANNGCWGHCDLEDVLAGADYLRAMPEVNAERIGITGTSYGGVMSMYAVAFAPDAFRAAIPASGYADWVHFREGGGEAELRHVKLLEHELGPFETSAETWWRSSAMSAVADVSTPVMLVSGVGRYPGSDQSELFARALTDHYKPFRHETYEGENYYVSGKANRRRMLLDMLDFLEQFLADDAVDASAPPPAATPASAATPAGSEAVRVRVDTSRGPFVIEVRSDWAPRGAERFLALVEAGYYDDARFHRVVPEFIVQWGLAGDPALSDRWAENFISDDPVAASNTRGRVAFAFTDPGTRSTQVFISLVDNARLDAQGFAPFGEIVSGMEVVEALHGGYGEDSGGGLRRGDQSRIRAEGNRYLDREYPLLDRLMRVVREP